MLGLCLSNRLSSVAKYVREGAVFVDIGTDHALLPIYLVESGKIERAICSDVNEGPLSTARRNASERGVCEKISFFLSDGLDSVPTEGITDVAICGMGGELILDIVSRAKALFSSEILLILQPMTRQSTLRRGLFELGFDITNEDYSSDGKKHYVTMVARYTGKSRTLSDLDAVLAPSSTRVELNASRIAYLRERRKSLEKTVKGLKISGADTEKEEEILKKIDEICT